MGKFEADRSLGAVSRIDYGGIRKLCKLAQAADNLEHTSAGEIGSADTSLEKRITGEQNVLFCTIEGY